MRDVEVASTVRINMPILHCTKKLLDDFGIEISEPPHRAGDQTPLGNWYAHVVRILRCKGFLFVNERTLFSFIVFHVHKELRSNLGKLFTENLRKALEDEEIQDSELDAVMSEIGAIKFAKTGNRSVLGSMNDLVTLYKFHIESAGSLYQAPLPAIIKKINRTPQKNLGWKYSIEVLKELLKQCGTH